MGNPFSSSTTSKTSTDPWSGLQPYLSRSFEEAQANVLDRPLEFFPDSTVTPYSPETEFGLDAQTGRAVFGNPLNPMAQAETAKTLGGEYLTGGAGHDAFLDSIISSVTPEVSSAFGGGGRHGSPLYAEALGRGVGRGMAPLYDAERNRMQQATQIAPQLAREDYFDIDRLMTSGRAREDLFGRTLQEQLDRWNFAQEEPYERISRFSTLLQPGLAFNQTKGKNVYNPNVPLTLGGATMLGKSGQPAAG